MNIDGVKVNIDVKKEMLRILPEDINLHYTMDFSPQFIRACKKDIEKHGHPFKKLTIQKHEGETLEKMFT